MLISVIIPARNAARTLARAVESLIATRYDPLEIVVVVDDSTDDTLAVAEELAERHDGRVLALTHPLPARRGVSAMRNHGIAQSRGDLVAFLDADDVVLPNRFTDAVRALQADDSIDGVYGSARVEPDPEEAPGDWKSDPIMGIPGGLEPGQVLYELLCGVTWPTSGILCRRSLLERTGSFAEDLAVAEDCNLWFRVACAGRLSGLALDQPVSVYYRRAGSAFQPGLDRKVDMVVAMLRFVAWMKRERIDRARRAAAEERIVDYATAGIILARESRRFDLARRIACKLVSGLPSAFRRRDVRVQAVCALLSR